MIELSALLKSSLRITLLILSASLLAWAVFPEYRPVLSGLILGTIAALLTSRHLAWRISKLAASAAEGTRTRGGLGFAIRAAIGGLMILVAQRLGFNLIAAVAGLFFVQLATLVLGIIAAAKYNRSDD